MYKNSTLRNAIVLCGFICTICISTNALAEIDHEKICDVDPVAAVEQAFRDQKMRLANAMVSGPGPHVYEPGTFRTAEQVLQTVLQAHAGSEENKIDLTNNAVAMSDSDLTKYAESALMLDQDGNRPEMELADLRAGDVIFKYEMRKLEDSTMGSIFGNTVANGFNPFAPGNSEAPGAPLMRYFKLFTWISSEAWTAYQEEYGTSVNVENGYYPVLVMITVNDVEDTTDDGIRANTSVVEFDPFSWNNMVKTLHTDVTLGESRENSFISCETCPAPQYTKVEELRDRDLPLNQKNTQSGSGIDPVLAFADAPIFETVVVRLPEFREIEYLKNKSGLCDACKTQEPCSADWQQCMQDKDVENGSIMQAKSPDLYNKVYGDACEEQKCILDEQIQECDERQECLKKYKLNYTPTPAGEECSDLRDTCQTYSWTGDLLTKNGTYHHDEPMYESDDTLIISTTAIQSRTNIHNLSGMMCSEMIRHAMNEDLKIARSSRDMNTGGMIKMCGQQREVDDCDAGIVAGISDVEIDSGVEFVPVNADLESSSGGDDINPEDLYFSKLADKIQGLSNEPGERIVVYSTGEKKGLKGIFDGFKRGYKNPNTRKKLRRAKKGFCPGFSCLDGGFDDSDIDWDFANDAPDFGDSDGDGGWASGGDGSNGGDGGGSGGGKGGGDDEPDDEDEEEDDSHT